MPSVFISYSSKDREVADYITSELKANSIDVFIDYQRLTPGQPFPDQLRDQIKSRDCIIFLVSSNSVISKWVRAEINLAHSEDKTIIPVILEKTEKFEEEFWFIQSIHRIDFTNWYKDQNTTLPLHKLVTVISSDRESSILPIAKRKVSFSPQRIWILIPICIILLLAISLLISRISPPPKVSLAYSFLLDTSDAMNEPLNGTARYEIAKQAIDKIVNFTGHDVKDTWRVLRKAGGKDCKDTDKVVDGSSADVPPEVFMSRMNGINPQGSNAYEKGINASLNDLVDPDSPAINSEVKVLFIFFASLNPVPCNRYPEDLIASLRVYKTKGIKTGLCLFGLDVDLPGFQRVKDAAAAQGVDTKCFINFDEDNADNIANIAIDVIQRQIGLATNEEEITPFIPPATIANIATPATATIVTPIPSTWTSTPTIAPNQPIEARGGPGLFYPVVSTIPAGQQLNFVAISEDKTWAQISLNDGLLVWVSVAGYGENILGILNDLPVILGPTNTQTMTATYTLSPTATATITPSPTPTATPSCIGQVNTLTGASATYYLQRPPSGAATIVNKTEVLVVGNIYIQSENRYYYDIQFDNKAGFITVDRVNLSSGCTYFKSS